LHYPADDFLTVDFLPLLRQSLNAAAILQEMLYMLMVVPPSKKDQSSAPVQEHRKAIDPVVLTHALTNAVERALPLLQHYMERRGKEVIATAFDPMVNMQERLSAFMAVLMSNPARLVELQFEYWRQWTMLWHNAVQKWNGEKAEDLYKPEPGDRRFRSEEWNENVLFDFIKQSYLMTSQWMHRVVRSTEGLDKDVLEQIDFYARQFSNAMAPTNFILTNPEVLKETIRTGGENLVKGLENLLEDMERGQGEVKISTTSYRAFEPGRNIAITKGSVIYQNDLIQLIQYAPATEKVCKTPVLIIPPWINKFYVLDLRPENSLVKWLVDQGHTVFMISWANPGPEFADKGFDDYMQEGILDAVNAIEKATGEKQVNAIAYCIGGTLLTMLLAWMKARQMESRFASATLLTTLIDFENAGELKLFTNEKLIEAMEAEMKQKGILSGDYLLKTFAMLRANDMIWSFVVNNYLLGREPFPFDLLYWNEDSTNMTCAAHSFYLRNMYLENRLIQPDGLSIEGTPLDVRDIDTPAYFLSTREDHIAPWRATYSGYSAFSGPKKFVLSASGHVAGVVNPPAAGKYRYWTGDENTPSPLKWLDHATENTGSWWTDWNEWVKAYAGPEVEARQPKNEIEPAPGSYVRKRAD
jgi:polyhydroxyalkanoate synthase